MGITLVGSAPSAAVSTADAKTHLNVFHSNDDTYIGNLVSAATAWVQHYTGTQVVQATYDYTLDAFPDGEDDIVLPCPPLSSVTSITYVDEDGSSQTLATTVYAVKTDVHPGRIHLKYEQEWPDTRDIDDAVTVRFVCGYANAAAVPEDIVSAILLLVERLYTYRGMTTEQAANQLSFSIEMLLSPRRVVGFA